MAIGKRFIDLARSELNALLDRAARLGDGDEGEDDGRQRRDDPLASLSDEELEAELERRRLEREIEERARRAQARAGAGSAGGRSDGAHGRTGRAGTGGGAPAGADVARAYAALEVPQGSDFETVRKAYRTMMRRYHPDRHTGSPEKQKAANELAQRLTESYKLLEKRLRR